MKNKNIKKGFTLIELLVVIAIIGLLSTIVAAPVQQARKRAKDTKKVAEVKAVQTALELYYDAKQTYPDTLTQLVPAYMPALPSFYNIANPIKDQVRYMTYSGQVDGESAVRNWGYHLGVHLDTLHTALDSDADCQGFTNGAQVNAGNGSLDKTCDAAVLLTSPTPAVNSDDLDGTFTPGSSDFNGTNAVGNTSASDDKVDDTCAAATSCMFDLTSSSS